MIEAAFPSVAVYDDVTPQSFSTLFERQQPVVLKGLVARWPAVTAGQSSARALLDYLKGLDNGVPAMTAEAPASSQGRFFYGDDMAEFNFSKRPRPVSQTLEQIAATAEQPDAPVVALQMMPTPDHLPGFAEANPCPLLPPQVTPRLWAGGTMTSQTHNDAEHNIACVVHGRRRFILFPPEQVGNLYIGPLDTPPPLSLARLEAPDFEQFPKFRDALDAAVQADLEPGDALFLPRYWWHHVQSLAPFNLMINYWWGGEKGGIDSAFNTFQTALLTLKDLPQSDRAYWRAMFETYIFGDGAVHIPAHLRGALGQMGPQMRERLRKDLLQTLLKTRPS